MTPDIDTLLNDNKYIKIAELPYERMIPFVQNEFGKRSLLIKAFVVFNIAILSLMLTLSIIQVVSQQISILSVIRNVFIGGTAFFIILIPIHEAIHGLAYKISGAPKVSFGGNWRKFYFYAVADKFVISKRTFQLVALAPFIIITTIIVFLLMNASIEWQWVLWGILLMHTGACAGDFGLLSFYSRHGGDIYTFDDVKAQIALFYQKQ